MMVGYENYLVGINVFESKCYFLVPLLSEFAISDLTKH